MKTKLTKAQIIALIAAREKEAYRLYEITSTGPAFGNRYKNLSENYFGEFLACQRLMMQIRGELEA